MTCLECGRPMQHGDERWKRVPASRDEPGHDTEACKRCSPSEDDLERLRDARYEQLISQAREEGWPT